MDEFTATLRAREVVAKVRPTTAPVPVEAYAECIGARIKYQDDLGPEEAGFSFEAGGKKFVCVNARDGVGRQRFTICHEIAHLVLKLPSEHKLGPSWSYSKRPENEVFCDAFAAELLLPHHLFKPRVESVELGFSAVEELAEAFGASWTSTGSRFALVASVPCAYVLAENGLVRYASRSRSLREARGWIPRGTKLPASSMAARVRLGHLPSGPEECDADTWFSAWDRGGVLLEDARHASHWDQTHALLWFEDEEVPQVNRGESSEEDESALTELDGILPWPGGRRRR